MTDKWQGWWTNRICYLLSEKYPKYIKTATTQYGNRSLRWQGRDVQGRPLITTLMRTILGFAETRYTDLKNERYFVRYPLCASAFNRRCCHMFSLRDDADVKQPSPLVIVAKTWRKAHQKDTRKYRAPWNPSESQLTSIFVSWSGPLNHPYG